MTANYNNCEAIKNYFTFLTVQQAAALWCGIPKDDISGYLSQCKPMSETSEYGKSIFIHPFIECLGFRCRVLQDAINDNKLRAGRDGGKSAFISETGHVAYSRRTVNRDDLREFIKREFPDDMPKTLFDEVERKAHSALSSDAFMSLQAELEASKNELDKIRKSCHNLRNENESLKGQIMSLENMFNNAIANKSSENNSDLLIIGGMLAGMRKAKRDKGQPVTGIQEMVIRNAVEACKGISGISASQMQKRFADANKLIKQEDES